MTGTPDQPSRLPSVSTILLVLAALVAAVSVAIALWPSIGGSSSSEDPAAKDWRVVGWAYAQNGDAEASATAYRRAAAIEPGNAENWSSLGEALQTASVTLVPEAQEALEKAIKLDPTDPRARYFLAIQRDLRGDHRGAVADWAALLRDTPAGAPWRQDLQRTIEQTATRHKIAVPALPPARTGSAATGAIPGPTAEQLAAASSIPPAQQDEMAQAMVARLAARLAANPRDADGWVRLMRSRTVLKDAAGAEAALKSGLKAFADDPAIQGDLKRAAAQLGMAGGG